MYRSILTTVAMTAMFITNSSFANCPVIQHSEVPAITELSYHDARDLLLAAGWQPLKSIHHNDIENSDISYGNGSLFWDKGYVEIESCAGTGLAPCLFNFADIYDNNLKVVTVGEESPEYNSYAMVDRYWLVCEDL
ncbi:hypothetical protein [Psychrobacter sp. P2G3]|uniref:hypothetical protein n=1 Tax=Psychrobacter sp. P2G3 TaxID=1699622 RepID=UPI00078E457B|nr:hypothetical protein [Psychrobacter sp. P2G3]AMN50729.1 hypothetical protein AK823_13415 [Psychrobacter sp. P2G3]